MNSPQLAIIITLVLLVLISCNNQMSKTEKTNESINDCTWLIGVWKNKTERGIIYEEWKSVDRNTLSGKSFSVEGSDTFVFETIQIEQINNELYYIPIVKNQNDGQAVKFKSKSINNRLMIFENPSHDFPQTIRYESIRTDSLHATVSGLQNGEIKEVHFRMRRVI